MYEFGVIRFTTAITDNVLIIHIIAPSKSDVAIGRRRSTHTKPVTSRGVGGGGRAEAGGLGRAPLRNDRDGESRDVKDGEREVIKLS